MSRRAQLCLALLLCLATVALAARRLGPPPRMGSPSAARPCPSPVEVAGRGLRCLAFAGARAGDVVGDRGVAGRMAPARLELLAVPLDLNRASVDELESLPGVGPQLAGRIAAGRPYAAVDEIRRVPGIGSRRLSRLRSRLFITAP